MASHPVTKLTEAEYLALDRAAEIRSEYVDGEMFAMSGGSSNHAQLHHNVSGELYIALRGTKCRAMGPDMRVRIEASQMFTYPDVVIICGEPALAGDQKDILLNPTAIVEVLSPSTEKYDRGKKFQNYRLIESLKDYILINQDEVLIEQFVRGEGDSWTFHDYRHLSDALKIESIGVSILLQNIYDRVDFPAA
jgi:Uma2 family endonuclease